MSMTENGEILDSAKFRRPLVKDSLVKF